MPRSLHLPRLLHGALLGCSFAVASLRGQSQIVFVDNFSGSALDPRWVIHGENNTAEYTVNFGMMNITRLPRVNPGGDSRVYMSAYFAPVHNFDFSADVVWGSGLPQSIGFATQSSGGPYVAGMTYFGVPDGPGTISVALFGENGAQFVTITAPAAGAHQFRLTGLNDLLSAYLDSVLVYRIARPAFLLDPFSAELSFASSPLVEFRTDLHVDRVVAIVPGPGTVSALIAGVFLCRSRRANARSGR